MIDVIEWTDRETGLYGQFFGDGRVRLDAPDPSITDRLDWNVWSWCMYKGERPYCITGTATTREKALEDITDAVQLFVGEIELSKLKRN